jgi:pSer/pThr/pTyr-binding forkhead associated (FHA) protein
MPLALAHRNKHYLPNPGGSLVGRSLRAEITLGHCSVSRNHCVIRGAANAVWVRDLGSRNGTTVNGRRVAPQRWTRADAGSVIRAGDVELVVEQHEAARLTRNLGTLPTNDDLTRSAIWRPSLLPNLAPMLRPEDESDLSVKLRGFAGR